MIDVRADERYVLCVINFSMNCRYFFLIILVKFVAISLYVATVAW